MKDKEGGELTVDMLQRIIANPFYAINIHPDLVGEHEAMITEEEWIKAGVNAIKESGAETYLKNLLANLKGEFV